MKMKSIILICIALTGHYAAAREYTDQEKKTGIVEGKYLLMLKPGYEFSDLPKYSAAVPMREHKVGKKIIVAVDASASIVSELEQHPAVEHLEHNGLMHLIEPVEMLPPKQNYSDGYYNDTDLPYNDTDIPYREGCYEQPLETDHTEYGTWGLIRTSYWNKPDYHEQPYLWSNDTDGAGVNAYIFDTGIELEHMEFAGGRARHGMLASEFKDEGRSDYSGHGSHVANTVGGHLYGVAKQCTLIDIKVLGGNGWGLLESNIEGLAWVVNDIKHRKGTNAHGTAKSVLNMSLAYGWHSHIFHAAMQEVVDEGATVAVAAGNSNEDARTLTPATFDNTITIAATEREDDAFAWFSSFGDIVDLAAPGVSITGAWSSVALNNWCEEQPMNECMVAISGTSMATPHVAGVVARYMSSIPDEDFHDEIDQEHIREMLIRTSSKGFISYQNDLQATAPNRLLYMGCGDIPDDQTTTTTAATPPPVEDGGTFVYMNTCLLLVLLYIVQVVTMR